MPKCECGICGKISDNPEKAFEHLVDKHGDVLELEYILEVD